MSSLLRKILRNTQYKATAIILATILWYVVQGEEVLEINRKILVHIKVPEGYIIKGKQTRIKDATLHGSRVLLGDFSTRPIEAEIKITQEKIGSQRFRIDKEYIPNWNPRIKLLVHDAYITVFMDEKLTRTIPVQEHLQGIPAEGYIVEKASIKPQKVVVSGLKSEVSKLKHITTEPVDVMGIQKSRSFEVSLHSTDAYPLELSSEQVNVFIQVGEKKINKRFGSIPIELEGQQFITNIRPNYVSIVIQGTPGILSFIKRDDLRAFLDIRQVAPGRHERKIQVKIPPDTVLIETFPEHAIVEIENNFKNTRKKGRINTLGP